jgi:hypothetical protein
LGVEPIEFFNEEILLPILLPSPCRAGGEEFSEFSIIPNRPDLSVGIFVPEFLLHHRHGQVSFRIQCPALVGCVTN